MPLFPQSVGLYPNSVNNVLLADMAQATIKGRAPGAGTGDPQDLTQAQLQAMVGSPLSFRNILGRNGGFEVWQRGAGGAAVFNIASGGSGYTADGWFAQAGNNLIQVGQTSGETTQSRYALYVARNSGQVGTQSIVLEFPLDTDEIVPARGQIVTLSFTAHCDVNYSPSGKGLAVQFATGTAAPARATSGSFVGSVYPINTGIALTTTPQLFVLTSSIVVPANATQASVVFFMAPLGTAPAGDAFAIDDVQLEVGSIATPFERRFFESELLACQRHYEKSFSYGIAPAQNIESSMAPQFVQCVGASSGQYGIPQNFLVRKRGAPAITLFNPAAANAQIRNFQTNADWTSSQAASNSDTRFMVFGTTPASSAVGHNCGVHWAADAGI